LIHPSSLQQGLTCNNTVLSSLGAASQVVFVFVFHLGGEVLH